MLYCKHVYGGGGVERESRLTGDERPKTNSSLRRIYMATLGGKTGRQRRTDENDQTHTKNRPMQVAVKK